MEIMEIKDFIRRTIGCLLLLNIIPLSFGFLGTFVTENNVQALSFYQVFLATWIVQIGLTIFIMFLMLFGRLISYLFY